MKSKYECIYIVTAVISMLTSSIMSSVTFDSKVRRDLLNKIDIEESVETDKKIVGLKFILVGDINDFITKFVYEGESLDNISSVNLYE